MGPHNFHEADFSNACFMMHISINNSFDRKLSTCIHVIVLNTDNIFRSEFLLFEVIRMSYPRPIITYIYNIRASYGI